MKSNRNALFRFYDASTSGASDIFWAYISHNQYNDEIFYNLKMVPLIRRNIFSDYRTDQNHSECETMLQNLVSQVVVDSVKWSLYPSI